MGCKIYINGISNISPQTDSVFEDQAPLEYETNILPSLKQDYKSFIKPMMLRRMSSAVKMGIFCAKQALLEAEVTMPDAILVGTGQGCLQDTEKFLVNMLNTNEGLLSPTSFIQSTHNTVAGQIALDLKCQAYNMTFSQNAASFESALIDALLQIEEKEVKNILVGGVDEISPQFTGFQKLNAQIKDENLNNLDLFESNTPGTIVSETAAFFSLSSVKRATSYARLIDVQVLNILEPSDLTRRIERFLEKNEIAEVDLVILGKNGDNRYDRYYDEIQQGIFSDKCQLGYKNLVGDNNSVSSYALWLASKILKEKKIPEIFMLNALTCNKPEKILIYNQYLGRNHGLILLETCDF